MPNPKDSRVHLPPACFSCGSDAQVIEWNRGGIPAADAICCLIDAPADWPTWENDEEVTTPDDTAFCDGGGARVDDAAQWGRL